MSNIKELTQTYNLNWTVKGKSERSSVPLGNGEVGISLWIEDDGDLNFYIGRTDALTETDWNVKLGKVSLSFSPNPFEKGKQFLQTLDIYNGCVDITADDCKIKVFVSKEDDTVYVDAKLSKNTIVTAKYENWRVRLHEQADEKLHGQSFDILQNINDKVVCYHQNCENIIESSAKIQVLEKHIDKIYDPLTNRIFGAVMGMENSTCTKIGELAYGNTKEIILKVTTKSSINKNVNNWIEELLQENNKSVNADIAFKSTSAWWNDYFEKSYIFVQGDKKQKANCIAGLLESSTEPMGKNESDAPSKITQAYILTKFMFACSAYGQIPIRFNGLLFNLTPINPKKQFNFEENFSKTPIKPTQEINPDMRTWGHMNLWQNQRHPYFSMLARGEIESMKPLFSYYRNFWDINKEKAKIYYDAQGQYNTEITTTFGLMPNGIYGIDRTGKPDGYAQNRWGGAIDISPGLELISLMLDYFDFTKDVDFLKNEVIAYAKDILLYIQTRFKERNDGKIVISPLQCLETFFDTTNPITVVVGMHAVIDSLLNLPQDIEFDREFFVKTKEITPSIPTEIIDGKKVLSPAQIYENDSKNVEPVELMAVFPFKYFSFCKDGLSLMKDTYEYRVKKYIFKNAQDKSLFRPYTLGESPGMASYSGWQYIGMAAAMLGISDDAKTILENNCALTNPGNRFPAMWGPIYDAVPDTDHGANILTTLQLMAMQIYEDKVYILPSWNNEWDITFKLYPFADTCVECSYKKGKLEKLVVTPESKMKDVVIKCQRGWHNV